MRRAVLALLVPVLLVACRAAEPQRLRVLTYNIHHGEGTDGVFDLERLARVIRDVEPDVVALQEVDRRTTRASGVDQVAALGRLTGMTAIFGKAMDYAGGGYGEAVLTRLPVVGHENHALPHRPRSEPRAALAVRVRWNGQEVLFVGTHLDHQRDPADRLAQVRRLNGIFLESDAPPVILAGDLNATPDREPMRILLRHWAVADERPTFPSQDPDRKIDYVLLRPRDGWRVVEARVLEEPVASDHCPLLVVLE